RAVLLGQPLREDPSALHRPLLALTELLGAGDLHGGGLGRDRVHERAALLPREDGGVELLEQLEVVVRIMPERGPPSVLCTVVDTTSAYGTGLGCRPAATRPAKWAMSTQSLA